MTTKLNEQAYKSEEISNYGSNAEYYDDQEIKYDALSKSFYTVINIDDELYIPVSVRLTDGLIRFTSSPNSKVNKMLRMPMIYRRQPVLESIEYMNQILFILKKIVKQIAPRLDQLMFAIDDERVNRYIMFLFKSPEFRIFIKKYRFDEIQNTFDEEQSMMFYYFVKTK